MKGIFITISTIAQLTAAAPAPQGSSILNGISNFLTSTFGGGGNAGEVDDYENAPYSVIAQYEVSLNQGDSEEWEQYWKMGHLMVSTLFSVNHGGKCQSWQHPLTNQITGKQSATRF